MQRCKPVLLAGYAADVFSCVFLRPHSLTGEKATEGVEVPLQNNSTRHFGKFLISLPGWSEIHKQSVFYF